MAPSSRRLMSRSRVCHLTLVQSRAVEMGGNCFDNLAKAFAGRIIYDVANATEVWHASIHILKLFPVYLFVGEVH